MIELFIDMGNSRIKVALIDDGEYAYLGAFAIEQISTKMRTQSFFQQLDFVPDHVYISSVADSSLELQITTAIEQKWHILPVFMSTQVTCCGIVNGYDKASKLGVDRWMALMGAQALTQCDFMVIDAGTAITVDAVREGQHQGGMIVPGLHTLRQALTAKTAQLSEDCTHLNLPSKMTRPGGFLATNTQSAICGGTLYMAAAFVNQVIFDLQSQANKPFKIYFTGGDGQRLSSLTNVPSEYVEDLVLQGIINVKENLKKG